MRQLGAPSEASHSHLGELACGLQVFAALQEEQPRGTGQFAAHQGIALKAWREHGEGKEAWVESVRTMDLELGRHSVNMNINTKRARGKLPQL